MRDSRHPEFEWIHRWMGLVTCYRCFTSTDERRWRSFVADHWLCGPTAVQSLAYARRDYAKVGRGPITVEKVRHLMNQAKSARTIKQLLKTSVPLMLACEFVLDGEDRYREAHPAVREATEKVLDAFLKGGLPREILTKVRMNGKIDEPVRYVPED